MPLRTLIVDDEPLARERLRSLLATLPAVEVVGECADAAQAAAAIRELAPDLLLLDVQMPEVTGLELAQSLTGAEAPAVVIVSAHRDHALDAFRVEAVDYVLKPFDRARIAEAVARAAAARERRLRPPHGGEVATTPRIALRGPGRISYVAADELESVDASGVRTVSHAGGRSITSTESIQELTDRLEPLGFARIHRSSLVNLSMVRELEIGPHGDYVVVLVSGRRLSVGRSYRARLRALLADGAAGGTADGR